MLFFIDEKIWRKITFEKFVLNKDPVSFVVCVSPLSNFVSIELLFDISTRNFGNEVEMRPPVESVYHVPFVTLPRHPGNKFSISGLNQGILKEEVSLYH
jgi:hypothetical protein